MRGVTWARLAARWAAIPALVLMAGGLAGCGHDTVSQVGVSPQGPSTLPDSPTPAGDFLSTSVTHGGTPKALVAGTRLAVGFADGRIRASGGCNTMSGPVRFGGGLLIVGELAQTDMGCLATGLAEQDEFLAGVLSARPAYSYDGTELTLSTADTSIAFAPEKRVQPDLALTGTRWDVTHVTSGPPAGNNDPSAAVGASVAPPNAYLTFVDGQVRGEDGCNGFSGPATIGKDTITFGIVVSTGRGCPGGYRADLVPVLKGTVTWRIDHTVLTLTSPSGAGLQLSAHEDSTPTGGPVLTPPCCKPLVSPRQ